MCIYFCVAGQDYVSIDETITFAIEDLVYEGTLLIMDDERVETLETMTLQIEAVEGVFPVSVKDNLATVNITNDDGAFVGISQLVYN